MIYRESKNYDNPNNPLFFDVRSPTHLLVRACHMHEPSWQPTASLAYDDARELSQNTVDKQPYIFIYSNRKMKFLK